MRTVITTLAAAAAFLSLAAPAGAASSDVSAAVPYGEPTWGNSAPGAPALLLRGPTAEDSPVRRDPTWPAMSSRLAPAIPFRTYVADAPVSPIENDGPSQRIRTFAPLDGGAGL